MEVNFTIDGNNSICYSNNMTLLPRIGEKLLIQGMYYKVRDILWHVSLKPWVQIKIVPYNP